MTVESRFDPSAVGAAGGDRADADHARDRGACSEFSGSLAELADPEINIAYGTAYLARAWRLANHDICTATMKYRAGHGETRFSFLSVDYCVRVRVELAALGFRSPAAFHRPVSASPAPRVPTGRSTLGRSVAQVDFKQLNTQLRQITDRIVLREK